MLPVSYKDSIPGLANSCSLVVVFHYAQLFFFLSLHCSFQTVLAVLPFPFLSCQLQSFSADQIAGKWQCMLPPDPMCRYDSLPQTCHVGCCLFIESISSLVASQLFVAPWENTEMQARCFTFQKVCLKGRLL